jgi:aspartate/tyrosine/aromatic aminotransferase
LGVGVYQDAQGNTPILACVKEAERRLLIQESSKSYLGIDGLPEFGRHVRELIFQASHEIVTNGRAVTVQTPGGTGALRVACDFIRRAFPSASVWCSKPTWPNHPNILDAAGLPIQTYPYFDADTNTLALDEMLASLRQIPAGDIVMLHGSCHNPSGIDPTLDQWRAIADVIQERGLLAMVDFAYQGFGDGLREDAAGLLELCRPGCELLVCSSYSKNFGLYRERTGALTAVAPSADSAAIVLSQIKQCVRANYSTPPAHGGAIVAAVLNDEQLRSQWEVELADMRDRINSMRRLFVQTIKDKGATRDFSFITRQRGMFSFSGLSPVQVDELRAKHSIYIVGSGRINVAGITPSNLDRLCEAIHAVL